MIVEVFKKGTFFKRHFITLWNIKSITTSCNGYLITNNDNMVTRYNCNVCELKVTY